MHNSILILGATASGKTKLAANLAAQYNGEIISADSRQVYKELIIGAGKDYDEYIVNETNIKYHVIDVTSIENTYYLKDFVLDAANAFEQIIQCKKLPIICGGTGLYLDALLKNLERINIPENLDFRKSIEHEAIETLRQRVLEKNKTYNFNFDLLSKKRLIRALEILDFTEKNATVFTQKNIDIKPLILGLNCNAGIRRKKITERLKYRLNTGLIEEVETLLKNGFTKDKLLFLGLEYKFMAMYLCGKISMTEAENKLEIAIHQFAKRQATWFRKMERDGFEINWIDANQDFETILAEAKNIITLKFLPVSS